MRPEDLPPAAQRQLAKLPPDLREIAASCYPSDAMEMVARREATEREQRKLEDERDALLTLADQVMDGRYGKEAMQEAERIFRDGGRTNFNLGRLRTALRKYR